MEMATGAAEEAMTMELSPAAFTATPTSVPVGGSVTVRGLPGDELDVVSGGQAKTFKLDAQGKATVKEPLGREGQFAISDYDPNNPHTVNIHVVDSI